MSVSPVITVFAASPDRGRGLARDMRVRWALEEAGQAYNTRAVSFAALKQPAHRALQPFGQIPTYEEGGLRLFETGAIVLHIADRFEGLLPRETQARARAIAWMFAAVNSVEPPILELETARLLEADAPWTPQRLPLLKARIAERLAALSAFLGHRSWLEGDFSAGDLMMVDVLRRLGGSDVLAAFPSLTAYVARAEARPAFVRAFAAQLAAFKAGQAAADDPTAPRPSL
jgi:glutathione S-transferase